MSLDDLFERLEREHPDRREVTPPLRRDFRFLGGLVLVVLVTAGLLHFAWWAKTHDAEARRTFEAAGGMCASLDDNEGVSRDNTTVFGWNATTGVGLDDRSSASTITFGIVPTPAFEGRWGCAVAEVQTCSRCGRELERLKGKPFSGELSGAVAFQIGGKTFFDGCMWCLRDVVRIGGDQGRKQ